MHRERAVVVGYGAGTSREGREVATEGWLKDGEVSGASGIDMGAGGAATTSNQHRGVNGNGQRR